MRSAPPTHFDRDSALASPTRGTARPGPPAQASTGTLERVPTRLGPLAVARHGSGGPPLLLWHSLFVDRHSFDPILPQLAQGRAVLAVDGPCHGDSPGPSRAFTLDDCALAAIEVLDHVGVTSVDFVGNAWGGHVGVVLALRAPERLRSLAVLSSPMQALGPLERLRMVFLAGVCRATGWRRFLLDGVVSALVLPQADPAVRGYVADATRAPGVERTLLAMRSVSLGRPSLVERLSEVEVPTLFVTTADDPMWTPELARAHAARVGRGRGARIEIISGARHLPPLEAPEATGSLLVSWLESR